ncbi:transglycosylase domain-containing protein [Streptomyces sp. NPDC004111]|uniref:transglycosylase domain-containing protein n=1 Tax=Streptomyces sp. NPDC004111 TaxID=3364690 RepID=UPI0036788DF4
MSEHRRKPPQPQGGGRAAARKAAQQPSGRRGTSSSRGSAAGSPSGSYGQERPYGGRAEARRAAQRGGGGGGRRGGGGSDRGGDEGPGRGRGRGGRPQKKRFIDYPRSMKYGWKRFVPSWKQVTGLCIGFVGALLAAGSIAYAWVEIPKVHDAAKAQNNVYYWDDGKTPMAATGGEFNRQELAFEAIPPAMQDAVKSAENKSFDEDPGVDPVGILRALAKMAIGGNTQGGSTITQQYVKNSMLGQEQTLTRKFTELMISIKVGDKLKKSEIMAGYLNVSYYGRGAYGLQAAARAYFNKDAKDLTPSDCAFLAAVLKGATYFDPAGAPEIDPEATAAKNRVRAEERWSWILNEMVKDGRLSQAKRNEYKTFPNVVQVKKNAALSGQIGYLVDLAKANFINKNNQGIDAKKLSEGGYQIVTTFNKEKVARLEKAVKSVYEKKIDPKKRPKTDPHVQFGGASVDPRDGKIVAVYGGTDATKHFTNNADQTGAQVGSTFKPFVLAAAMQYGKRDPSGSRNQDLSERTLVSPKSIYNGDDKLKIKNFDGSVWRNEKGLEWLQTNDGHESYGPIDLREAMRVSANSPYVQLGMDVGIDKVRETAINAGLLKSSLAKGENPSFSIGISDPSAIRMAGAYATFAASGKQHEPYSVKEVKKGGNTIWTHDDVPKVTTEGIDENVANNVTEVLKNVVEKGTGSNAKIPGREVAGKTGTTDGNKSAWFVGYTPELSTAIDMYRMDDNADNKNRAFLEMFGTGGEKKIHGASFPSQIWHDYMVDALKGTKPSTFPVPEPIGETLYGGGAKSPEPTPTNTPSPTPSETPENTPSPTTPPPPSPGTTPPGGGGEECDPFDWECKWDPGSGNGGAADGGAGANGGNGGGETQQPPPPTEGAHNGGQNGGPNGGGGNNGGLLGGNE